MSGINHFNAKSFNAMRTPDQYHVSGYYHVSGVTKPESNQGFIADLEIDHIIDMEHSNSDWKPVDQLVSKLRTAIFKIKSFRSKECADTLSFDAEGLVQIEYRKSTHSEDKQSRVDKYPITDLCQLERLADDISHGPGEQDYTPLSNMLKLQIYSPLNTLIEILSGFCINALTDNESKIEIQGVYCIKGANDEQLEYNTGFKTRLSISQRLNMILTDNSSETRNHLGDILSTALNKANAFRNPDCKDLLHFSGRITVKCKTEPAATFQIIDLDSFKRFVDYILHLKLLVQNNDAAISSAPQFNNQSLNPSNKHQIFTSFKLAQGKLQRQQVSVQEEPPIDGCWQRLKKFMRG